MKAAVTRTLGRRIPVDARPEFTAWYCSGLRKVYRVKPCEASVVYFSTQPRGEEEIFAHWEKLALGGLRVHRVSGKHKEGLFDEPNVSEVARVVESYLMPLERNSIPVDRAPRDMEPENALAG